MILARRVEMKTRRRRKRECFYVIILMNSILFARLRFILCVYKWKERKTCAGTEFMSVENVFLSCFCFAYICQLSRALVIILIVEFILFISFERTILDSLTRWAWEGGGGRPAGALEGEYVLVTRHMCVCVCVREFVENFPSVSTILKMWNLCHHQHNNFMLRIVDCENVLWA